MVNYRLYYFPIRANGETARQLFALANVAYENVLIPFSEWPEWRKNTPFGHLPVLEVDGKPLAQSKAINRYLAQQFGYAGENAWDAALIDSLADQFVDYMSSLEPSFIQTCLNNPADKEKVYKEVVEPSRDKYFPAFARLIKENESGFLVGNKVSWIDLTVANHIQNYSNFAAHFVDNYPELKAHRERVHSIPAIKHWIEKRPPSEF